MSSPVVVSENSEGAVLIQPDSPTRAVDRAQPRNFDRVYAALYGVLALASLSLWSLAVRAPLWLDETGSYWVISGGFSRIWTRSLQLNSFPAYYYILRLTKVLFGGTEVVLRIPSILAMLGALYLLYRAARELFDREVALITAAIFSIHPVVVFAAIDVRPYAFGALAINATVFLIVRWRRSNSDWMAACIGIAAAVITYFHLLFGVVLPALAICFVAFKWGERKALCRQVGIAGSAFSIAFLPVIPGSLYMFHTRAAHVFDDAPALSDLGWTLAPGWLVFIFGGAAFVAAASRRLDVHTRIAGWRILLCASLGLIPILILYAISTATSMHIFVPRYRLVAIPGIALCWGMLASRIDSRILRALFCVAAVGVTAYQFVSSPLAARHGYSWKYALEFADKNASADHAPMLICSDLPEADAQPMPAGDAKESALFSPLTYYRVSAPVVPLPRTLNQEAMRIASDFLEDRSRAQQRFLALGFGPSYPTLKWLSENASATHNTRLLGEFDGIAVLEFVPRRTPQASR